jgi:hypothetical protein
MDDWFSLVLYIEFSVYNCGSYDFVRHDNADNATIKFHAVLFKTIYRWST